MTVSLGSYYWTAGLRSLCHAVKRQDEDAVHKAASLLSPIISNLDCTVIPVPCSQGRNYTLRIADLLGKPVADILENRNAISLYELKKKGLQATADIRLKRGCTIPEGRLFLLDNVVDTGTTYRSCVAALGRNADMLCLAQNRH